MWLDNCDIDLDYHIRRVQIRPPGGRRELDAAGIVDTFTMWATLPDRSAAP